MGKSYQLQMTVPTAAIHVWHRAQDVLRAMPNVSNVNAVPGAVQAQLNMSMTSWGEKLTVSLAEFPGGTNVHIHSTCSFGLQLVDWGKNKKNVEHLAQGLKLPGT